MDEKTKQLLKRLNNRIVELEDRLDDEFDRGTVLTMASGAVDTAPTAIDSIDLFETGNPNELGVQIVWTDATGTQQTTVDATPITLPAGVSIQTATAAFTTTNGTPVAVGGSYLELSNGDTWAFESIERGDASNLNGAPQDLSANLLSLLPDRVGWHFHVRQPTTFTAGGALMNVTVDGENAATGVTMHVVPDGAQGFAIRVGTGYQVNYQTLANTGISADPDQQLTLGSDNLPYLGPACTDVTEQFVTGPTSNPGNTPPSGILLTEITVNKTQDITVVHTGTGFSGAAGSGWGIADAPMFATANSIAAANVYSSTGDRIDAATPSKTYTVSLTPGTYYIGVWSGGLSGVTSHTLDVTYCKPEVDVDVRFVETRCYQESGASLPLDSDGYLDEIRGTQLATLPAGAHMRWTAPTETVLNSIELHGFGGAVAGISWTTSNGLSGSGSVTFDGTNPEILNLGDITLGNGDTIDFTLDSLTAGQMQLSPAAASAANGWTALQDYSAFANTSHWATTLNTSTPSIEHKVNVYEDTTGATVYAEVNGEDLTDLASIPGGWSQVDCAEPDIDIDWIKEECYNLPATNFEFTTNAPVTENNGNMLQASGAVAPVTAPLRLANSGTEPIQVDTIRVRAGANGFVALPAGNLTIGGVQHTATSYEDIDGIYRTIVFTPTTTPLVLQPGDSFTSQGNWALMTGGFQGPVSSGAGTNPPFGGGTQARAEIEYTVGTPLPGDEVTVRTYEDGSLKLVDKTANTLTDLTTIDPTWTPCTTAATVAEEDAIEVQLDGNFTLPTAVDGDVHNFSVEALPVSIDTTGGEPIDGDLDFTRYTVGDQLTALPQNIELLEANGTPVSATQPDNAPNTVNLVLVPGVVELTRGANGGLLNSVTQSGSNGGAVVVDDVEWFYNQGGVELPIRPNSLTDTTTPTTTSMRTAFDAAIGDEVVDNISWIRIISTGQVFELDFTSWQAGGGGGFSVAATEMSMVPTLGWNVRKSVGEFISADANNALQRRADGLYVQEPQELHVLSSFTGTSVAVERTLIDGIPFLCMADNEPTLTSFTSQDVITPRDVTADVYIDFTIKRATAAQPDSTFRQTSNFTAYFQQLTFNAQTGVASVSSGGSNPDPEIILADVGTEFIRYVVRFTEMPGSFAESWRFRPAGDTLGADTGTIYFTEDGFSASTENPVTTVPAGGGGFTSEGALKAAPSGTTNILDGGRTWNDLINDYSYIRFEFAGDVGVGPVLSSKDINTADIVANSIITVNPLTGSNWSVTANITNLSTGDIVMAYGSGFTSTEVRIVGIQ